MPGADGRERSRPRITIAVELAGGLAVLGGAFIPLARVPMAAVLLVAIFTVRLPNGFSSIKLLALTSAGARGKCRAVPQFPRSWIGRRGYGSEQTA